MSPLTDARGPISIEGDGNTSGPSQGLVILSGGANVSFCNLTFRCGRASDYPYLKDGGAIRSDSSSSSPFALSLVNCTFAGNSAFQPTGSPFTQGKVIAIDPKDGLFLFRPFTTPPADYQTGFTVIVRDGTDSNSAPVGVRVIAPPPATSPILTVIGADEVLGYSAFGKPFDQQLKERLGANWTLSQRGVKGFAATDLFRPIGGQSLVTPSSADKPTGIGVLVGENDVLRLTGLGARS